MTRDEMTEAYDAAIAAEQAGGADESPTKYYGGPRGGSMSQNAPLAAPTEAEVEACAEAAYLALQIPRCPGEPWDSWNADPASKDMYRAEARACLTKFLALRGGR